MEPWEPCILVVSNKLGFNACEYFRKDGKGWSDYFTKAFPYKDLQILYFCATIKPNYKAKKLYGFVILPSYLPNGYN